MKHGSSVHERYSVQYIKGFDMSCIVAFKSPSRSIGDGIQLRICRSVGLLDARVGHCRTARSSWGSFLVSIEPRRRFAFFFMSQNVPCCMSQRVRSNYVQEVLCRYFVVSTPGERRQRAAFIVYR